ncbi:glucosyl transferase [Nostoc sp. 'Peltigera membranacea cyanobiont' 210A]|uniref:glycosyltransferase family 2 protein n=1 Tax=Nostoc sp. 'Peltigera membranacea cyanobiont' 210A TaxID=2014529 RepID=UPI000B956DB7|nr:glycosyltransferase [Nostoc sp. 'Peltigera membranacea cyanobiont' 210A]OYD90248.1 glucosyl transferase [Nostoc sp. 'Peltigera membranacea cyanobiont' 210A]
MPVNTSDALPLVSILINNYNYGQFLADAINSAVRQTYPHIEVIVVDDGSTDCSREVIASYKDKIIPVFKQNGGQASAFNAGFAASRGDIICFLDADDAYKPEKVFEVVNVLKNHQESCWCFHMLQFIDAELKTPIDSHYDHQDSGLVHNCDLRNDMRRGRIRGKLPFSIPATSGLCFTRSLLQQILPMPEAGGIVLNDSYLQFTSLALAKGLAVAKKLALQRVHSHNTFIRKTNTQSIIVAKIHCLTAYWIRKNFPFLFKFTDNFFAVGLSNYWRIRDTSIREIIDKYFIVTPVPKRILIYTKALYYCFIRNY